jgi:ribonuclease BN (tRNA processing enzyme)
MTLRTKKKRGMLIAEKSCLHGKSRVVDEYHQNALARVIAAKPDQTFDFDKLRIKVTRSKHYDPTVGFHIEGSVSIGYPADGPYFAGQSKPFTGCDVLILNALMPAGVEETIHLSTDGAAKLAKKVGPKLAVLQHFGFTVLRAGLNAQRDFVERRSGVKTVVARDGMLINLDELKPETGIKKFFMKK